jgi:hypothetical protein
MKQLVLGALMIGATNIATGCIFVSDDDDGGGGSGIGDISLAWTTDPGCPPGATTAEAIAIRDDGEEFTDLFDCEAGVGEIADLAEGPYDVHINITSEDGNTLFAQSFVEVGVVVIEDLVVDVDEFLILTEEAFFAFSWVITENGEIVPDCEEILRPDLDCIPGAGECDDIGGSCDDVLEVCRAPATGTGIVATFLGDNSLLDTSFDCAPEGDGLSTPFPLGEYTGIVVDLLVQDSPDPDEPEQALITVEIPDSSLEVGNEVVDFEEIEFGFEI